MDTKKLQDAIDARGIKLKYISEKLGISRYGLYKKINGASDFTSTEMKTMEDVLGLTKDEFYNIFFA